MIILEKLVAMVGHRHVFQGELNAIATEPLLYFRLCFKHSALKYISAHHNLYDIGYNIPLVRDVETVSNVICLLRDKTEILIRHQVI